MTEEQPPVARSSRRTSREQIEGLVQENRTLGETLDGLREEIESLRSSTREAVQARQAAEEKAAEAQGRTEELERAVAELKTSNERLEDQVGRLSLQVERTPLQPLTPKEGSILFDRTFQELRDVSGFEVRDADLSLKLATAKLGEDPVFVLPEPGAVDPATLHELKFRFRSIGSSESG